MADIKISQLGAAIAVGDTDLMPIVSGGNTLKATAAQVKEHSIGSTNISGIGDGSVTGAISTLNTDKQPKTLDTPLTIGGVSKTTVEAALDGLNSESQSLSTALTNKADTSTVNTALSAKAPKTDLASIIETSPTSSQSIPKGTYFYLDGILAKALTDISSGATFTVGTNFSYMNNITNKIGRLDWPFRETVTSPFRPTVDGLLVYEGHTTGSNGFLSISDSSWGTVASASYAASGTNIGCNVTAIAGNSYTFASYNATGTAHFVPYK